MRNMLVFGIMMVFVTAGWTLAPAAEIDIVHAPVVHTTAGSMATPLTYLKYFLGERERYGYNPLYTAAPVNFDLDNIPYIRVGVNPQGHDVFGEFTTLGKIQTLDATGRWINLTSWLDNISTQYPDWDKIYSTGVSGDEQIIFDSAGDAYTVVCTAYDSTIGGQNVLLYSKDKCRTWQVYPLGNLMYYAKMEMPEAWNDTGNPPVILGSTYQFTGGPLYLISPKKTSNGRLNMPPKVTLTSSSDNVSAMAPMHSGMGNSTITKGNIVYVVYLRNAPSPDNTSGTPQYILSYDNASNTITGPIFLGASDSTVPDVHDGPAITMDSQGYLHVILGSHGKLFQYTKSLVPYSITGGWTTPVFIGYTADVYPEWTYIGLVCDKNDTLHIVGRYSGHGYYFGLWYMRKKAGQAWEENLGPLVMPFRAYYSCWYHKLTMDRQGRLFVSYIYYGDQYDRGVTDGSPGTHPEIDNYTARWPWEGTHVLTDPVNTSWSNVSGHDPCIIMSDDGGDSWRLALTSSLQVFGANSFDNGLDGWKLDNGTGANPIKAMSSYTYNSQTITPRTGPTFACSEFASAYKKATRTIYPAQAGTVTGYLNMVQNTNIAMIEVTGGSHSFYILANSVSGLVSYRIDAAETATAIAVTPQAWRQVKFVAGAAGLDGYWDGALIFHSDLATSISSIVFGSEAASAPCGYDDFSFFQGSTISGQVVPGGYSGNLQDVSVKIEFRKNGSAVRTERINLDVDGRFILAKNGEQGLYNIAVNSYQNLRKVLPNVDLTADTIDLGPITLTGGDMNGDNAVNPTDLAIVLANMDQEGQ